MNHARKTLALLAVLVAALGLAACGGGSDSTAATDAGTEVAETGPSEETVSGDFAALPGAPAAYDEVGGEAVLTRSGGATTTTIELTGLEPDTEYMAHLHTESCEASDPGGPHFKFNPDGSDEPPNEIHFMFSSGADGSGSAEAASDREVPVGEAGSVVVHLADHHQMAALFVHEGEDHGEGMHEEGGAEHGASSDKVACADLEAGATAESDEGASASVPTIVVENGEPVGGIAELEFSAGEEVRFKVEGDEAEEIHLHGYDLMEDIPAGGGTVEFDFPAEIEGIFEAELEGQGVQILELQVNP